ncbi:MAG: sigma-54-dependent Fis family transcriptional regulator [Bacteroidetes bacterium]|nr:sigma-54-dependent Fis family transcriptional regulator [Bacteroidota bacterium]
MSLKNYSILAVDDDPDVLTAVRLLLKPEVKEVIIEKNPENLTAFLSEKNFDLVLLDMNFKSSINTGNEGLYWLKRIKEIKPQTQVIMITAYGHIDLAVRSLKDGAADFIVKPWHNENMMNAIRDALKSKKISGNTPQQNNALNVTSESGLIGESDVMKEVFLKINKVAPTDANILILGENGTGKDLVAKALHQQSLRAKKPFIKIDVGAITDTLFESELFGHKKGAFTDAREDRVGQIESANSGTLFLDEIGNIQLPQQAKLLTVLQNRQVTRLGTNMPIPVDIRLVCATNLDFSELANEKRFRKDLVYRINTVEIHIPPLRKRGQDIILLARHFAKIYTRKYMKPPMIFEESALEKLLNYAYPGNVRELQYTIERAIIMKENNRLEDSDLIFSLIEQGSNRQEEENETELSTIEKNTILRVIEKNKGNITKAAKELGITRTALYRRLNKYDI